MEKIRALIMRQDGEEEELWLGNAASVYERLIGGEISMLNPLDNRTTLIYNNDAERNVPTRLLRNKRGNIVLALYGTVIATGLDVKRSDLTSLTDNDISYIRNRLET